MGPRISQLTAPLRNTAWKRGQIRSERQRNRPELCRLKNVPKPKLTGSKTRTTERIFDVSRDSHVLQNTVLGCKPQEVRVKITESPKLNMRCVEISFRPKLQFVIKIFQYFSLKIVVFCDFLSRNCQGLST